VLRNPTSKSRSALPASTLGSKPSPAAALDLLPPLGSGRWSWITVVLDLICCICGSAGDGCCLELVDDAAAAAAPLAPMPSASSCQ